MHLIDTKTLRLREVTSENDKAYAIFSHRWQEGEVLFEDMADLASCTKPGVAKLKALCNLCLHRGMSYAWMDTCCIDKKSSAGLSEAINSMYKYYAFAKFCIAYLCDVDVDLYTVDFERQFRSSVWFTRCWTLQELIAPAKVIFYNSKWRLLADKDLLLNTISDITNIADGALKGNPFSSYSIAERMSWASNRQATRREDVAYSLMGIFDINMPMLYGEGTKAFARLQEEIIRVSDDETIFGWSVMDASAQGGHTHTNLVQEGYMGGLLAPSPSYFHDCSNLKPTRLHIRQDSFTSTNRGLAGSVMVANVVEYADRHVLLAFLNASFRRPNQGERFIAIYLRRSKDSNEDIRTVKKTSITWTSFRWEGSHADVAARKPHATKICVRHKGIKFDLEPMVTYGFGLLHRLWDLDNDRSQIQLARDVQWNPDQSDSVLLIRNDTTSRPICTFSARMEREYRAVIQLGLSSGKEPICLIQYEHEAPLVEPNYKPTTLPSSSIFPSSYECIHWSTYTPATYEGWKYAYEVDLADSPIGFLAFKGGADANTIWHCYREKRSARLDQTCPNFSIIFEPPPKAEPHLFTWNFRIDRKSVFDYGLQEQELYQKKTPRIW